MNLDNLKCFISLAECLNFTRAAEKEHMTQTSMSRRINSLEDDLGVQLFYRDNHQVNLTEAGQELYLHAQKILDIYSSSVKAVQNIHQGFSRSLKLGVGIYENELLRPFLGNYVSEHPELRITCLQYSYYELLKQFDQNQLDVILTSDQFLNTMPTSAFDMEVISDHSWLLALHKDSPLSGLQAISPSGISQEVLITMYDGSFSQTSDHYKPFFQFRDIIHVNSYDTKMMMVNAGLGYGMVPDFVRLGNYSNVVVKPFDFYYAPRNFYILCHKSDPHFYVHEFFEKFIAFTQARQA